MVTVRVGNPKHKTYRVSGKTLREVEDEVKRKGPPGADGAGLCSTGIVTPGITAFDARDVTAVVEYVVTAKAGPTITLDAEITLPELTTRNTLSAAAKKEWDRFLAKLSAHETEHVAAARKVAEEIAGEIGKLEGSGSGKDKASAIAAARNDFLEQYRKTFAPAEISKRLQDAHDRLDRKGNKFDLDVSIE